MFFWKKFKVFSVLSFSVIMLTAFVVRATQLNQQGEEKLLKKVQKIFENVKKENVKYISKIDWYRVETSLGNYDYITSDGRYLFHGSLYELQKGKILKNLTAEDKKQSNASLLNQLVFKAKDSSFLIFRAKDKKIGVLYVFTDPFCPYCKKFQETEVPKLLKQGVEVRYLPLPLIHPPKSNEALEYIFCQTTQKKRRKAFFEVENTGTYPQKKTKCQGFSDKYTNLALRLGAQGTPFLLFEDGSTMAGAARSELLLKHVKKAHLDASAH